MPSSLVLTSKFSFEGSQLPCFTSGSASSAQMMKSRFHMNLTEEQLLDLVNNLVDQAINSLTTKLYDGFQYYSNGILWMIPSDFSHKIYSRSYVILHYQLNKQCINHEYSKYYYLQFWQIFSLIFQQTSWQTYMVWLSHILSYLYFFTFLWLVSNNN